MKSCGMCHKFKSPECFSFKNKEKEIRQSHCRDCQKIYRRQHYLKNKKKYIDKAVTLGNKVKEANYLYIFNYLEEHPCVDCGEKDVRVLEFDHIEPSDKKKEVSSLVSYSLLLLRLEIEKCEVRCANCHRIKTIDEYNKDRPYQRAYVAYLSEV